MPIFRESPVVRISPEDSYGQIKARGWKSGVRFLTRYQRWGRRGKLVPISDALRKGLGEFDTFSDSRTVLQVLFSLIPRHRAVAEIKSLVKGIGIKVYIAPWIRAHVGYA